MSVQAAVRTLAFGLLLTPTLMGAETVEGAERPLTLGEAIGFALEKNEGIIIERESLSAAESAVIGAKGAYDPLLEIDGGWRRATEPINSAFSGAPAGEPAPTIETLDGGASLRQLLSTGGVVFLHAAAVRGTTDAAFTLLSPAYDTTVGLALRQPLLRNRAVDAARLTVRVATSDRERAVASLRREVTETVAAVERAYWTLVAVQREVRVREEGLRLADEQLSETGIRVEGGAAPETEIAQPRAELERRRGELLATREAVARAENALKLLILDETDVAPWAEHLALADAPETPIVQPDVAALMDRALALRPELEMARAGVDRQRTETVFARDRVRPALDAVVSYDRFGLAGSPNPAGGTVPGLPGEVPAGLQGGWGQSFDVLREGDFDDTRAGLVFSVPIGRRTARAALAAARSFERQAEADLARARKAVRAEVLNAAAALDTTGQRIEAARAAREAAEVQLLAEHDRYAAGLSTNFLVLTRQNDLSRARLDEIAALTDYRQARTEVARATGSLLAERRIDVDGTAR